MPPSHFPKEVATSFLESGRGASVGIDTIRVAGAMIYTFPVPTPKQRAEHASARIAYYAIWLETAFVQVYQAQGIQSKVQLSTFMRMCAGCGMGTGNYCDGCDGPMCSSCENEVVCPTCGA